MREAPDLAQARLYRVDVSAAPARIMERLAIGTANVADQHLGDYDLEGVAVRSEGNFWFASEGRTNAGSSRANLLVKTDASDACWRQFRCPGGPARW